MKLIKWVEIKLDTLLKYYNTLDKVEIRDEIRTITNQIKRETINKEEK